MKFEDNLNTKVDMSKVKLDVLKPWISDKVAAILSCERALRIDPNHFDALMLYGYLAYGEFPQAEKAAFRGQEHRKLVVPPTMTSPANLVVR